MTTPARDVVAHVVLALRRHQARCRTDSIRVPPEVIMIADLLEELCRASASNSATERQEATAFAQPDTSAEAGSMDAPLLLTRREVAAALRVSVRSVDRLVGSGRLPIVRVGSTTRIRQTDLDAYVASLGSSGSFREQIERKASA